MFDNQVKQIDEQANKLRVDAAAILMSPECSAEDIEKAERMSAEADALVKRANLASQIMSSFASQQTDEQQRQAEEAERQKKNEPTGFKSLGEFVTAAYNYTINQRYEDPRLSVFHEEKGPIQVTDKKAMAEGTGATGGIFVPTEQQLQIRGASPEGDIVRSRATVIPINRRSISVPVIDQTSTTADQPHWFGGIYMRLTEEAGAGSEDTPEVRQVTITAWKQMLYSYISNELLSDSAVGLEAFLTGPMGFAGAIQWAENYLFMRGTGVGQPWGVIYHPAAKVVARQADGEIQYTDLVNMLQSFLSRGGSPVWVANLAAMSQLMLMNGPSGNPVYLWGSAADGVPGRLLGYPIIFSEFPSTLGLKGDLGLYDFSAYLIVDRESMTVDTSTHNKFENDQVTWRVRQRVGGQPWLSQPIALREGTLTVSPFVVLGDKSS